MAREQQVHGLVSSVELTHKKQHKEMSEAKDKILHAMILARREFAKRRMQHHSYAVRLGDDFGVTLAKAEGRFKHLQGGQEEDDRGGGKGEPRPAPDPKTSTELEDAIRRYVKWN